jgi:hypothetical protein
MKRATILLLAPAAMAACAAALHGGQTPVTPEDAAARALRFVEANVVATHAFQVRLAKPGKADAACWSAGGLSDAQLQALVERQKSMLAAPPQAVKAWAEGRDSQFDPAKDLDVILKSPLRAAADKLPVNVLAAFFAEKAKAPALSCRAAASLLQMMLDVDRDGDVLQQMYAIYVALGLPVHTEQLGLAERTDEEFLAVAQALAPRMCQSPVDITPPALRMMLRKMWNWGHRYTGQRDARVVAGELMAEPDIKAVLPRLAALPARKIAVIGHSFTMGVHWSSPSSFVLFVMEMAKQAKAKLEFRLWQAGGLNPARADCRRFALEAQAWKPDLVLIVVATRTPQDVRALGDMVAGLAKGGAQVVMFDTLRLDDPGVGTSGEVLRDLAAKGGLKLLEVAPLLASDPQRDKFVCLDGIHMTEPYHRLLAREWLKYLAGARQAKLAR